MTRPAEPSPPALGDVTVVRVADALAALGAVAAGWRRRFDPLVVGITGSIAKTSTKEAVATVLGAALRDAQDRGQPEQRDRAAADAPAPRARSTRRPSSRWACTSAARSPTWRAMARPSIGVVTAVQPVHLSRIGTLEAVEQAKGELLEALPADGTAVLNADDPIVRADGRPDRGPGRDATASPTTPTSGAEDVESARRRRDALHAAAPAGEPAGDDPDARPAVGPQRAGRGGRRAGGRAATSTTIVDGARARLVRAASGRAGPAAAA